MEDPEDIHVRAVARWLEGGITSATHPMLAWAFAHAFAPLGIEADWLEAEPFGQLETGVVTVWLRQPRWIPSKVAPEHPGAADLAELAPHAAEVTVGPDGLLRPPAELPDPWRFIRHSAAAKAEISAYLAAAAAALVLDAGLATIYAAGEDDAFRAALAKRLDPDNPTDGKAGGADA